MARPKFFFTLPTTIYHPDDLICLGQVIGNPSVPYDRLAPPPPLDKPLKVRISKDEDWFAQSTKSDFYSVGLFAHALNTLTAESSRSGSGEETTTWDATRLETQYFEPSEHSDLAEKLVAIPAVKDYLNSVRFTGGSAYVITGVKIARSPGQFTASSASKRELKAKLAASVDPQGTGAVRLGGDGNKGSDGSASESKKPTHDYVVAYRMSRIYVSWWTGRATMGKAFAGGELAGVHEGRLSFDLLESDGVGDNSEKGGGSEIKNASIESDDVGMSLPDDGFEMQEVEGDDGTMYTLVQAL